MKLYAFKKLVMGGIPSSNETDEQGQRIPTTNKTGANLLIFLSYPPALALSAVEVWLNGEVYTVKTESAKIPIEITYNNGISEPETTVLVPQSTDTVITILLSEKLSSTTTSIKRSLAETNDVVLVYKMNRKYYAQTLKRIKGLRVGVMQ